MFENIHFLTCTTAYDAESVKSHKEYKTFARKYGYTIADDTDYFIQGSSRFLLSRPLPDKYLQNLLYMQSFSYMEMGVSYYTKRKNYPSFLLLFTYGGKGSLVYEGNEYVLKEGDIFLIDCRKYHYYKTLDECWKHSDLHIWGKFVEFFYLENVEGYSPVFHCKQTSTFQQQLENILRFQTSNEKKWEFLVSNEIEKLLLLLLGWMDTKYLNEIPEALSKLRMYLEHHFQEEITLDKMAKYSGISKYYLCRQFKMYTGFSPKEYILGLRITQAKMLLQTSSIPSYYICTLVGFTNEANFIRQFKKLVGMTPGQFRKQFTA